MSTSHRLIIEAIDTAIENGEWNSGMKRLAMMYPGIFVKVMGQNCKYKVELVSLYVNGESEKIPVIKTIRHLTGMALADAKHFSERVLPTPLTTENGSIREFDAAGAQKIMEAISDYHLGSRGAPPSLFRITKI